MVVFHCKWCYGSVCPYAAAFILPGELSLALPAFSQSVR